MKRKEVYATSGTRIKLRTFAGFDIPVDMAETGDLAAPYKHGVPMGGRLYASDSKAEGVSLFVWAVKDPDNVPLAKIQVIKGWIEEGSRQALDFDVACGGSELDSETGKCKDNGATVNVNDCSGDNTAGASQLKTLWTDPDFGTDEDAFYYVRVLQNPTCRWSTYDSLRLGREPLDDFPVTVAEMAWGSPIWVKKSSV